MAHNMYKRRKVGSSEELEMDSKLDKSQGAGESCEGSGTEDGNLQRRRRRYRNASQGSEDDDEISNRSESPGGEGLRCSVYESKAFHREQSSGCMESADSEEEFQILDPQDEAIIKCAFNTRAYDMIMSNKKHCVSEEQSCVWPPMVVVCFKNPVQEELKHSYLEGVRTKLVAEAKLESVKLIKDVCSESPYSFNLFLLPSSGAAFMAARAIDNSHNWRHDDGFDGPWSFYPSYMDMCDMAAGLIPESTREFLVSLPYCGMSREEWINAPVVLLRAATILVGFGVCRYSHPEDIVDGVVLGDSHVGVTILQSTEGCSTDDDVFSCRRWNMKYVLSDGISLFERLRQYEVNGWLGGHKKASQENREPKFGGKDELLIEDSMKSLVPLVCESEICLHKFKAAVEEDDGELCSASSWYKTAESMIHNIEECERGLRSESLGRHASSEYFFEKLKALEAQKIEELEEIVAKTNANESLMQQLWTMNDTFAAKCVLTRLKQIDKLIRPYATSDLLCQMRQAGEEIELKSLESIHLELKCQKSRREQLAKMTAEAEESILLLREQQHKELLQRVEQNRQMRMTQLEAYINEKFKFVASVRAAKKETESVLRWNSEHTANAINKVSEVHIAEKKKVEAQMLVANLEKSKLEEEVLMAKEEVVKMKEGVKKERKLMKKNNVKFQAAVRSNEGTRMLVFAKSAEIEKGVLEKKILRVETVNKDLEAKFRATETSLKDTQGMLTEVTDLMNESATKNFTCAICFDNLEGCPTKTSGRDLKPTRKRACFHPCMHANMCTHCSVAAWEAYRRCPICNMLTSHKPQPVYL